MSSAQGLLFQAKFKEIRNARQGLLKTTHRHVLETVAYILNTDAEVLEEGVLDKDEYMNAFSSFFADGGRQAVVVYLQPMSPPAFGITMDIFPLSSFHEQFLI